MFNKLKEQFEKDKPKFAKQVATGAGVGLVAVTAFPYVVAGTGLALGFWLGRKAVGQIEVK